MSPYYPTLAEDVARAKEILAKGKPTAADYENFETMSPVVQRYTLAGGTIYGADTYAAYKLLESFVEAIEAIGPKVCELALRHELQFSDRVGDDAIQCVCRTRGCGHAARLHVGGICQACKCEGWS